MKNRAYLLLLSLLAAALLSLSWYAGLTILIFFGFVPLFAIEENISGDPNRKRKSLALLTYYYIAFLIWNVAVTWWVVFASAGGAALAFIFNSLFMAMVFVIWSAIKSMLKGKIGMWTLIPVWVAWEHIHTLWDISWTWLTLGNVFAYKTSWIQWYEFTGTSGGTFWILLVNILVYQSIRRTPGQILKPASMLKPILAICLPVMLSLFVGRESRITAGRDGRELDVVIAQPNIDPYNEKFTFDYQSQFIKVLRLLRGRISNETDYVVLPETFITGIEWYGIDENYLNESEEIRWFRDSLLVKFPALRIVAGGNTYRYYPDKQSASLTARKEQTGRYFDVYNTAIYIDRRESAVYHKSKLVPGVEKMPFPALMKPLEGLAIDMGGTVGSLGMQDERDVFTDSAGWSVAPVICYESIYADYVTDYIRKGADFIFIVTNDGWWKDTPGYIQHLNYGRLRSIENRRQTARCANTGISCFIDEYGRLSQLTSWWKEDVIQAKMKANTTQTFFSRYGDLLSVCSLALSAFLLPFASYSRWRLARTAPAPSEKKA
jgi:apolipoprotein N-acyltransferase